MATYYSSSNNQRDAAPIHYLRVPFANSYAESSAVLPSNMMMYADSGQQNSCAEIPIPSVGASDSTPPQQESLSNLGDSHIAEHNYGAWILNGSQGLSLSLSTQIPSGIQILPAQFRNPNSAFSSFENSLNKPSANGEFFPPGFAGVYQDSTKSDPSVYGMSGIAKDVPNSKYLRATQQLLDEVVNVHEALKPSDPEKKVCKEAASPSVSGGPSNPQESELSPAERQEFQNKLTKLLSMVDEVDRRYKQYYHQMQIVVSSFDVIAGYGAAKPYTALALQTISRHFRCLRDAITGQIQVTRKNLGEENISINSKGVGIARLRYVDKQLRQQRALQQLGMMQQPMWRPQRGLPETSVSVLRAWLFEHFLHPYPKDSDKIMLARQTGLTRSQVSNWFINARVRLWKPMVEEMYKEETGDVEMDSNSSSENASKPTRGEPQASEDRGQDVQQSTPSTAADGQFFHSSSDHIPNSEMSGSITGTTFLSATHQEAERPNVDYCSLYPDTTAYQISELGRFGNGGGVSLTLGLQHCDGPGLHGPGVAHHGLVAVRGDDVYSASASSAGPETVGFDCMDPGNQKQPRFSSSHLLHDFVA